jgi:hypothetical protein
VTAGLCALLYEAYLKPKLLQGLKKKKWLGSVWYANVESGEK